MQHQPPWSLSLSFAASILPTPDARSRKPSPIRKRNRVEAISVLFSTIALKRFGSPRHYPCRVRICKVENTVQKGMEYTQGYYRFVDVFGGIVRHSTIWRTGSDLPAGTL